MGYILHAVNVVTPDEKVSGEGTIEDAVLHQWYKQGWRLVSAIQVDQLKRRYYFERQEPTAPIYGAKEKKGKK